jgi:YD repeat-containing protein
MKQAPAHPKPRNDSGSISAAMFDSGYRFPFSVVSLTGFARFVDSRRAPKPLPVSRLCFAARMTILALSAMLGLAMPSSLTAQITDLNNTPKEGVGHNYIGMLNETVNPENGQVSLRFDFSGPPGRKLDPKFALSYNSSALTKVFAPLATPLLIGKNMAPNADNGWSYTFPYMTFTQQAHDHIDCGDPEGNPTCNCRFNGNYVFYDSDGSGHNLPLVLSEHTGVNDCRYAGSNITSSVLSGGDEDYWASMPDIYTSQLLTGNTQVTIRGRDGTVYQTGWDAQPLPYGYATVESIEDRNGNIMHIGPSGVTDDLGRSVVQAGTLGSDGAHVTVSGLMTPYTLHWAPIQIFGYSLNSAVVLQLLTDQWVPNCQNGPASVNTYYDNALTSLVLPNGQQYTFTYDPIYGTLKSITYPSGGKIEYIWGKNPNAERAIGSSSYVTNPGWANQSNETQQCTYQFDTVALTDRYVDFGSGQVLHQTYSYTTIFPPDPLNTSFATKTTTVTTYDLTVSASQPVSIVTYTYGYPLYNPGLMPQQYWQSFYGSTVPVETSVDTFDGSGHHLSTAMKSWMTPNLLLNSSTTTYTNTNAGSLTSGTNNIYDSHSWQRTEEYDCDFVSGNSISCGPTSFTRKTTWGYQTYPNLPPNQLNNFGILDESCQKIMYDGGGNRIAETDNYYDGGTALCGTPGTQSVSAVANLPAGTHDETCYGMSTPGSSCPTQNNATVSRGNLTKSISRCFSGSGICSQGDSTTTYSYDETGQVTSMTDPRGKTTTYNFTDNYTGGSYGANTNARLTSVTDALGYTTSYAYDYSSGQLTRATDPNSQSTTYVYNDSFSRPTQANYPDGGQTTISYNDSPPSPSVTTTRLLSSNPSSSIITTKVLDGMGHPVRTILSSDPSGPDYTDTTYYGTGQVHTVSNAYRSTSDPTYGTTTYAYDGLGRKVTAANPDNSIKQWCYNDVNTSAQTNCKSHASGSTGQWVDYADEKGNDWQQTTDGLGRLIAVNEPNGSSQSPSMETDYQYDLLNNLISVAQKGNGTTDAQRVRTFTYDSLSQLLCANNPENSNSSAPCPTTYNGYVAGTTGYSYDPNGNLVSKIDARGITTTYAYDQLNRLLAKSYTNDPNGTPSSCYQYDQTAANSNGIGRLWREWTQNGACPAAPASGFWTKRSILNYDSMGRILNEQQYTPASQLSATPYYAPQYTYDLAGNLTSSTSGVSPTTTANVITTPAGTPITFTYTIDGAGRLQTLTGNVISINGVPLPATLFSPQPGPNTSCTSLTAQYWPFGGLMNATFGNGLALNRAYDNRMRTTCEIDTGTGATVATPGTATVTITGVEQSK